jgi:hypothetical protein
MTDDVDGFRTKIIVEQESPGNPRTLFRVMMYGNVFAEGLTAAQAHVIVGDILETLVLPQHLSQRLGVVPGPSPQRLR